MRKYHFMQFDKITYIRKDVVDGETDWLWIKDEIGAWNGPVNDWTKSHSKKYFQHVKKFDAVITAGGNQGLYARFYSKRFKNVYVFEPDPLNFFCLTFNTQSNNVYKYQMALGETSKSVSLKVGSMKNTGEHRVDDNVPGIIPCLPLDAFNFHSVDLIQLDVEEYEANVIKGATETIKKFKPVIILENGHKEPCLKAMARLGYKAVDKSVSDTIFVPV